MLCIYSIIPFIILYDNTINAQNITKAHEKIKEEKQVLTLPNTELLNLNKKKINLKKINKNNTLVINFWASWCTPCLKEMPELKKLSEILKKFNVQIIYINQDSNKDINKVLTFIKKYKLNDKNIFLDPKMKLSKTFKLKGLPTTFIINGSGEVLWRIEGIINWTDKKIIDWLKQI
tara:strand:+ start:16852 stop:17379 length:528 start_codon:yes stop_codon:yes gene_type:complete